MESKTVSRFEDLIAWQKARALTTAVYAASATGAFSRDFALRDQIRRAAVSVMSNIAEGFERGKRTEFHPFLSTAKSSCAELRSQLYIALDVGHLDHGTCSGLMASADEVGRILGGLRSAVARQRDSRPAQSSVLSPQS